MSNGPSHGIETDPMNSLNSPPVQAGDAEQLAASVISTDTAESPCPYCYGPVVASAQKCRHCGEFLDAALEAEREREGTPENERLTVGEAAHASNGSSRRKSLAVLVAASILALAAVVSTLAITVWGSPGTSSSEDQHSEAPTPSAQQTTTPPPSTGWNTRPASATCANDVRRLLDSDATEWADAFGSDYPQTVCAAAGDLAVGCVGGALDVATETIPAGGHERELFRDSLLATCVLGPTDMPSPPRFEPSSPTYTPPDYFGDWQQREQQRELDQLQRDLDNLENCRDYGISCY